MDHTKLIKLQILRLFGAKEFLDIQAAMECRFTLKRKCDMVIKPSQICSTNKYCKHNSICQQVWRNS